MAITKAGTALTWASGSATQTGVTVAVDVSGCYGETVYVKIVQVVTATTAANFKVQVSPDGGTTYYDYPSNIAYAAGTAAATYEWAVSIPVDADHVQISYTAQSGGTSSTLTGHVGKVTAV